MVRRGQQIYLTGKEVNDAINDNDHRHTGGPIYGQHVEPVAVQQRHHRRFRRRTDRNGHGVSAGAGGRGRAGQRLLSNLGAGSYDAATGLYTIVGTAAEVTAALNNLVFTPTNADAPEHSVFAINVVDSAGDTASNRITTVVSAHPMTIATNGATILASVANAFIVENAFGTAVSFLKLNGSVVTTGTHVPATGWTPVGAVQTGSGYEVAFSNGQGAVYGLERRQQRQLYQRRHGRSCRARTRRRPELAGIEANFGELGANSEFLGTTPATPTPIGTNGQLRLAGWEPVRTEPRQRGTGPLLELNGSVVTTSTVLGFRLDAGRGGTDGKWVRGRLSATAARASMWSGTSIATATSPATPRGFCRARARSWQGVEAAFGDDTSPAPDRRRQPTTIAANGVTELDELEVSGSDRRMATRTN